MREFDTGATRDDDSGKFDFEGFLSPEVLWEFAEYMTRHAETPDGHRDSDNWQKGIPQDQLMKSLLRHIMDVWLIHRGANPVRPESGESVDLGDALAGAFFNLQAYWLGALRGDSAWDGELAAFEGVKFVGIPFLEEADNAG